MEARAVHVGLGHVAVGVGGVDVGHVVGGQRGDGVGVGGGRGSGGGAQGRRRVLPCCQALEEEEIMTASAALLRLLGRESVARAWNLETNACLLGMIFAKRMNIL